MAGSELDQIPRPIGEAEHHARLDVLGDVAMRQPQARLRDIQQNVRNLYGRGAALDDQRRSMSIPILATKLYIPPPPPKVVVRPRLVERLNEGQQRKLTLISAPAGFGKTTLVSTWAAGCDRPVAWLSLDEGDNDVARFLIHLVAAVRTIAPTLGGALLGVLRSPRPPPTESIVTALINDLTTILNNFVLVIDDYQVIDAKPVDTAVIFLLEHPPTTNAPGYRHP